MTVLKYILLLYALFGLLVAGGLLFNRSNKANVFLALYSLVFSLGQLDFLYKSSRISFEFPQFNFLGLSFWFLLGPFIWFYLKYFNKPAKFNWKTELFHFIPAIAFVSFTIYMFYNYTGIERLHFAWDNFVSIIMPINYSIAIHISAYGILFLIFILRNSKGWHSEKRLYINTIVVIYIMTVVVESYLTVYADTYQWFLYYFLITSSIVFVIAYFLYFKPEILSQISKKYYSSGLSSEDKQRIARKIIRFSSDVKSIIQPNLNLQLLSESIGEKKHNVSQTISEEMNTTFKDIINRKRIDFAKQLLSNKDNPKTKLFAIALDSGFTNKTTFHRAFVKYTGQTPNDFRKKNVI